jgi:hypothetical protein
MPKSYWSSPSMIRHIKGDVVQGSLLDKRAREAVGYTLGSMDRQTYKVTNWHGPDGSTIRCYVWKDQLGERAVVRIMTRREGGVELGEKLFIMENGWMWTDIDYNEFGIGTVMGHTIYVWDEIIQNMPGIVLRYEYDVNNPDAVQPGSMSMMGLPELDADNSYQTTIEDRQQPITYSEYEPHRYSGLARLFMQAKRGAGRTFLTDFHDYTTKIGAGPGNMGCIRSPQGNYWIVYAARTGVYAVRLGLEEQYAFLDAAARNAAGESTFLRNVADAIVLASALPTGDVVTLVPYLDASLESVYIDSVSGSSLNSLAWGWCWKWQTRTGPDEFSPGAVIVTHASYGISTDWRIFSRKSQMTFGWDTDENGQEVPTATITNAGEWRFAPGAASSRILTCDNALTYWRLYPPPSSGGFSLAEDGTILAWYNPDGSEGSVEYKGSKNTSASGGMTDESWADITSAMNACAGGSSSESASSYSNYTAAVWSISSVWSDSISGAGTGSYAAQISSAADGPNEPFAYGVNPSRFRQCDGSQLLDYFWTDGRPDPNAGWIQYGSVSTFASNTSTSTGSNAAQHLLIGQCPAVAWYIRQDGVGRHTEHTTTGYRPLLTFTYGGLMGGVVGYNSFAMSSTAGYTSPPWGNSTRVDEETYSELVGEIYVNGATYTLTEDEVHWIGWLCSEPSVVTPLIDGGASSIVSYGQVALTYGIDPPAGMSYNGSRAPGIFIGGV